jgi:hypothetical protein
MKLDDTYSIGLYDAPRTIIDAFRLRHAIGPDIANEALRRWLPSEASPLTLCALPRSFPERNRLCFTHCKYCCENCVIAAELLLRVSRRAKK